MAGNDRRARDPWMTVFIDGAMIASVRATLE
jgi:hypothetical protein